MTVWTVEAYTPWDNGAGPELEEIFATESVARVYAANLAKDRRMEPKWVVVQERPVLERLPDA